MGTCSSTSADQAIEPVRVSPVPQNITKTKHKFEVREVVVPHGATANGRITDLVIKTKELREMEYSDLYDRVKKLKAGKYTDNEFPAAEKSIGSQSLGKNIQWKRPQEFIKDQLKVFQGRVEAKDIKQGRLGDCYLMSALILISRRPEIIKRLFETTEINELGMYGVWLCVDGQWKIVIVDDMIPTEEDRAIFSRNNGPELWVLLLEKAYAKTFGSYNNIQKGLVGVAINALTGAPYDYFQKDSKARDPKSRTQANELWDFIQRQIKQGHLLAGSTQVNDRNANFNMVSGHAYAILDTAQVKVKTRKGEKNERLLRLANPWGKYEWTGAWSDKSELWTAEARQACKYENSDDGTFWMNIEDFFQMFGQVCSCKYQPNYVYSFAKVTFPALNTGFKGIYINVPRKTKGTIGLTQSDHRRHNIDYRYGLIRTILLHVNSGTRNLDKYIDDMMDCDRDTYLSVTLEPGEYYLAIEADWHSKDSRQLVVSFYGQNGVTLVQDTKTPESYDNFLNQMILLHQQFTEKQRIHEYSSDINIRRITGSVAGYVYYHYKNESKEDKYLSQTVTLKEKKFIQVFQQEKKDEFCVKVLPGQQKIIKLRVDPQGNGYYSYSTKIQFYIVEGYSLEKLRDLCNRKPTKTKKREVEGKPIDVIVKTFSYSGGIAILYQNKMDKYAFIQELNLEMENLELENATMTKKNQVEIELEPQTEKLLSFVVARPGVPVVFRTTMSFYLNSPEFKF